MGVHETPFGPCPHGPTDTDLCEPAVDAAVDYYRVVFENPTEIY